MSGKAKMGYLAVSYLESMPDNWELLLEALPFGYARCVHNKDIWKEDTIVNGVLHKKGEPKKAHIHFFFQGVPTAKQKEYIHASLGIHTGLDCRSANGAYDYLTHENDTDKYHYSKDSITHSSKWSQELFESGYVPKRNLVSEILSIIQTEGFTEYCDLMEYIAGLCDDDLAEESKKLWVMRAIDSKRNKLIQERIREDMSARRRTRRLTPDEAKEVDLLFANAKQLSLSDFGV